MTVGRGGWRAIRPPWKQPAFCLAGLDHPSAKAFPLERPPARRPTLPPFVQNARGVTMFDPKTKKWSHCRHLLRHASSELRLRRRQHAVPWRKTTAARLGQHQGVSGNRRLGDGAGLDRLRPRHQRQWRSRRVRRARQPVDPTKDMRLELGLYGISADPSQPAAVWGSNTGSPAASSG